MLYFSFWQAYHCRNELCQNFGTLGHWHVAEMNCARIPAHLRVAQNECARIPAHLAHWHVAKNECARIPAIWYNSRRPRACRTCQSVGRGGLKLGGRAVCPATCAELDEHRRSWRAEKRREICRDAGAGGLRSRDSRLAEQLGEALYGSL